MARGERREPAQAADRLYDASPSMNREVRGKPSPCSGPGLARDQPTYLLARFPLFPRSLPILGWSFVSERKCFVAKDPARRGRRGFIDLDGWAGSVGIKRFLDPLKGHVSGWRNLWSAAGLVKNFKSSPRRTSGVGQRHASPSAGPPGMVDHPRDGPSSGSVDR